MLQLTRWLRFALVGGLCFTLQWLGVHFVFGHVFHPFVADVISFSLSAQVNFWLSKTITWGDRKERLVDALASVWWRYNGAVVLTTAVNATVFWSLEALGDFVALVFAVAASSVVSFALNHRFVFRGTAHLLLPEHLTVDVPETVKGGVAIFMPAHNEADNLPYVVADAVAYLNELEVPFNIIIVDDGSQDATAEVVKTLMVAYPEVTLVQHAVNRGYGAALRTGFRAALATRHDWIGFCDSDGQFRSHDFGRLIGHAAFYGADICIGYRIKRADGLVRLMMGRAWHMLTRIKLGYDQVRDVDCGFKVFKREAVVDLANDLIGGYAAISPEIIARSQRAGHKIVQLGVGHYPRPAGKQSGANLHTIRASFKDLSEVKRNLVGKVGA